MSEGISWAQIVRRAEWSDKFFNYPDAEAAYHVSVDGEEPGQALREAAEKFIDDYDDCPYGVDWLVADFLRRV